MHEDPQRKPGAQYVKRLLLDSVFSENCQEAGKNQEKGKPMSKRMENGTSKERLKGFFDGLAWKGEGDGVA